MRVAVLSDIHANFQALEAVLNDVKNNECEKVLCLGDLAMAGPEPVKVIDFVQNQGDWLIIQGNTDELIAEFSQNLVDSMKNKFPVMANALVDDVKIINDEQKEFLKNLPKQQKLEIEGVKILMVHGSPRKNNEDILPDMPLEKIEEIVKDTDAGIIFCGHTHVPCGYQTNCKKTVVNVGSVGRPMTKNPDACYCIVEFEDGNFTIEHRFVPYDRITAAKIMSERSFEGAEQLADMILNPKERHL